MNLDIELPEFITPLMKKWLIQYKLDFLTSLTSIGLFHWDYSPNKRKPEKPRRIPRLDARFEFKDSSFKNSIYFFEIDSKTLHVFESSGIDLGGLNIAHEYLLQESEFVQTKVLMKMIR